MNFVLQMMALYHNDEYCLYYNDGFVAAAQSSAKRAPKRCNAEKNEQILRIAI